MTQHHNLTDDLASKAKDLREDAQGAIRTGAEKRADALRDAALDQATNAASAADAAAAEFGSDSLQARAAHQIADQVERVANRLRASDLSSVTRDVTTFARENPALFIGGAALIGFAATRFLKARSPNDAASDIGQADPWATTTTGGFDVPS